MNRNYELRLAEWAALAAQMLRASSTAIGDGKATFTQSARTVGPHNVGDTVEVQGHTATLKYCADVSFSIASADVELSAAEFGREYLIPAVEAMAQQLDKRQAERPGQKLILSAPGGGDCPSVIVQGFDTTLRVHLGFDIGLCSSFVSLSVLFGFAEVTA